MPFSLSSSALNDYQRYLSLLVGNAAYVDTPPLTVNYLVIAGGGGGGGGNPGGGGGAGGYRSSVSGESSGGNSAAESALSLTASTGYTVTVGAGGAGQSLNSGNNGSNSVFASITSIGGGGGSGLNIDDGNGVGRGKDGGSGGGAADSNSNELGGVATTNQGSNGGNSGNTGGTQFNAAGGGGAGQAGSPPATAGIGGVGGNGLASSITGSSVTRAGGGGGGAYPSGGGAGGSGGGGNGGVTGAATTGAVNTGGGGGGGYPGVAGGSGLVVVKYPIAYDMTVGAGLGYKTVMSGDYKITEFTSGTGTVSFALAPTVVGSGEDILQEIVLEESASSVTFSGLDAYASTYQHLQIRSSARTDRASTTDDVTITINSITNSYAYHTLFGNGSSIISGEDSPNKAYMRIFLGAAGSTATANAFGAFVMDILDPFSSLKNTTVRSLAGTSTTAISLNSGMVNNTAAVDSMTLSQLFGSNFVSGSRFTLIGVK